MCVHGAGAVEQHETKREHRYIWCDQIVSEWPCEEEARQRDRCVGWSLWKNTRAPKSEADNGASSDNYLQSYLTVYIQLRDQQWGLDMCKCLCEFKCANVCWDSGSVGTGLDTGGTVSRETGICLKTTYTVSCVCLGNAANQRSVHDLQNNECQHYTNVRLLAVCHNFTERSAGL